MKKLPLAHTQVIRPHELPECSTESPLFPIVRGGLIYLFFSFKNQLDQKLAVWPEIRYRMEFGKTR